MNPLHERIRRLPAGVEFLVVVSWAFGLPIFSSIMSLATGGESGSATRGALVFNNQALTNILVFELLQSAFLIWFLRVRGWTLEKFGLSITWRGTGLGWLLLVGTYVLAMGAQALAQWIMPLEMQVAGQQYPTADPRVSMQLVFLTSTVNGIFEEVFVAGYIITALTRDARHLDGDQREHRRAAAVSPVPGADWHHHHRADGIAVRLRRTRARGSCGR